MANYGMENFDKDPEDAIERELSGETSIDEALETNFEKDEDFIELSECEEVDDEFWLNIDLSDFIEADDDSENDNQGESE